MNKGDELYDLPAYYMKFLKYDPSWHQLEGIHDFQLKNNPIEVKVQGAPNAIEYYFTSMLVVIPNWCGEECVAKASQNLKA